MKSRNYIYLLAIITTLAMFGCDKNMLQEESFLGNELNLEQLSKTLVLDNKLIDSFNEVVKRDSIDTKSSEIPLSRDDLTKMRTMVKIYNGIDDAGISIPGFGGIKLGKEEISLNIYYIETKVINNETDTIVYGCGYSVHYLFKKVKKGLSIDNLPSIAASVQLNSKRTQVHYSLQTYGIKGNNLVRYFKPTINKNFNVEGFGVMQSSIDGIHNILGDSTLYKSVQFNPEILKFIKPYELEQI
jgi:hypothetical protein